MGDITKLKFWCHKILPLVYDNSLSYYEFLCKVVAKLNEVIEKSNTEWDVYADVKAIMDEWLEDGTIASLIPGGVPFSENIVPEYMYTYLREDARYSQPGWGDDHCTIQSMCVINANTGVFCFSKVADNDNTVSLQKFNLNTGALVGNAITVNGGHGNNICFDGNYLYITWYYEYTNGTGSRTNKVTKLTTDFVTLDYLNIPVGNSLDALTWDDTTKQFIALCDNDFYMLDINLTDIIKAGYFHNDFYLNYYDLTTRFVFDSFECYNGYIFVCSKYPPGIFVYDMDGVLQKIYNLPISAGNGANLSEFEKVCFNPYTKYGYTISFARDGSGDFAVNTLCRISLDIGGVNKIVTTASTRPWQYDFNNRVYVDGKIGYNGKMLGTAQYPFRTLQQAFNFIKLGQIEARIVLFDVDTITNVGTVDISGFDNIDIRSYSGEDDNLENNNFFIPAMTIGRCTNVYMFFVNIGTLNVYESVGIFMGKCKVDTATINRTYVVGLEQSVIDTLNSWRAGYVDRNATITTADYRVSIDMGETIT